MAGRTEPALEGRAYKYPYEPGQRNLKLETWNLKRGEWRTMSHRFARGWTEE